jgi:hypothetical protein
MHRVGSLYILSSPYSVTQSRQTRVAHGTSKQKKTGSKEACVQSTILLIPKWLQSTSYFSWYLSVKRKSSCKLSLESQINSVKLWALNVPEHVI